MGVDVGRQKHLVVGKQGGSQPVAHTSKKCKSECDCGSRC